MSFHSNSSWWTMAVIQRCSQMTPKGYTHCCRQQGTSCTRPRKWRQPFTKERTILKKRSHKKNQHDHNLSHGFPDASASIIFCVNCGRGLNAQIGLFSCQWAKYVMDETLHWCHHRARWIAKRDSNSKTTVLLSSGIFPLYCVFISCFTLSLIFLCCAYVVVFSEQDIQCIYWKWVVRTEKENMDTVWRDIVTEQWWWDDIGRQLRATMAHGLVICFIFNQVVLGWNLLAVILKLRAIVWMNAWQ